MTDELDLTGRVRVLEHGVHKLETRVETGFTSLDKAIRHIAESLQSRPVTPPFKEIMITVGATLAVVMTVASIIAGYVDRTIALSVAEAQKTQAVLEYRLNQVEKAKTSAPQGLVMIPGIPRQ